MCWKGRGNLADKNKYNVFGDWCVGEKEGI